MHNRRTGILLLNMGGPDTLDDIPEFLYNLFSDRDIIRLGPSFLQRPLARLISRRRAPKSKAIYAKIGGGSPLRKITTEQAEALEKSLAADGDFVVRVAMRYWHPTADEAVKELLAEKVNDILALPLYPQYTRATSGSSLSDLRKSMEVLAPVIPLTEIRSWPDEPEYIESLAAKIRKGSELFKGEPYQLVYSAHSLPVSFIKEGDPYVEELQKTITALEQQTGTAGLLCYQSRSGPVEWLSPETAETIESLAAAGCKNLLVVPISFVSDHVETLYEIDMLFKEKAATLSMRLESTESLNTDPLFISALRTVVLRQLGIR